MVQPTHSIVQKGGKRLARDHRPNNSQRYFYVQPSGRSTPSSQSGAAVEGCSTPSSQSGAAVESSSDSSENEDEKDSEEDDSEEEEDSNAGIDSVREVVEVDQFGLPRTLIHSAVNLSAKQWGFYRCLGSVVKRTITKKKRKFGREVASVQQMTHICMLCLEGIPLENRAQRYAGCLKSLCNASNAK